MQPTEVRLAWRTVRLSAQSAVDAIAYLPPPVACETTQSIVERHGGEWIRCSDDEPIDYAVPVHASAELRRLFQSSASVVAKGEFVGQLPNGRVFGASAVISPDGRSVARDVSVDFGKPFDTHWLLGYQKIRPPVRLPGVSAVAATALGSSYAHWLLDELPRVIAWGEQGLTCDRLLVHATTPLSRAALERLPVTAEIAEPRRYSHYECERLVVPSLIAQPGFPTPRVGRLLSGFVAGLPETTRPRGELIYVSRANSRRRRVTNESQVQSWLQARGFATVFAEDLTWAEQVAAFRAAKVIVAPHGAGLANLVFCRPGTRVVELFHRAYVNGCYWRLSSMRGLDYRPVVAEGADELRVDLEANALDVTVDMEQLTVAVRST